MTVYGEREHREARAALTPSTPCWYPGCHNVATTIDHVPALAEHAHAAGSGCCRKLPACAPHNYGAGARLANRRRAGRRPYASRRW